MLHLPLDCKDHEDKNFMISHIMYCSRHVDIFQVKVLEETHIFFLVTDKRCTFYVSTIVYKPHLSNMANKYSHPPNLLNRRESLLDKLLSILITYTL